MRVCRAGMRVTITFNQNTSRCQLGRHQSHFYQHVTQINKYMYVADTLFIDGV